MPDLDREIDDVVRRWTTTKVSWAGSKTNNILRPGSYGLNEMTDQMNIATMEILGLLGRHDPVWWESLAELCGLAKAQLYKHGGPQQ